MAHGGASSLRLRYNVQPNGYADCGQSFEPFPDWSGSTGLSLWLRSEVAGQPLTVMVFSGDPMGPTPFEAHLEVGDEWTQFVLPWTGFGLAAWADAGESAEVDPARMIGYVFSIRAQEASSEGSLWIDDVGLHSGEIEEALPAPTATPVPPTATSAPAVAAAATATATATAAGASQAAVATPTPTPVQEAPAEEQPSRGFCPFSAMALPLGAMTFVLVRRRWRR